MKNTITKMSLIILFLGSTFILKAQDDMEVGSETENNNVAAMNDNTNPRMFEHQFGFNATQFIQTLFGISGFTLQNPYQVNYKFLKNLNQDCFLSSYGLRAGYGQLKSEDKVTQNTNNFFNTTSMSQTNLRLGIEVQKRLNDKWVVFAGVDYTYLKSSQESKSVFNNPPNSNSNIFMINDKSNGVGPVFGIQFNVTKHIVMNTELSYYITKGTSSTSQESIFNGISNKQSTERELKTGNITIPAFVNFNISF